MGRQGAFDRFTEVLLGPLSQVVVRNNKKRQSLSRFWIWYGRCSTFIHARDRRYFCFHLPNAYPKAADFEEVTAASFDPEVSFFVESSYVSCLEPTIAEFLRR